MLRIILFIAIAATALAQDTFRSTTQLVIETVSVTDKSGKPVEGLTAKDFVVTEDGAPQQIRFFEYQRLDETKPADPISDTQRIEPLPRLTRTQIASYAPGEGRYRDRRLIALYFDLSGMPVPDQLRAFRAARQFVRTQMTASDMVAILAFSGGSVQVLQDFTADRGLLLSTIETLIVGEDENAPITGDTGAAFGQNDAEFNIFFTDRQLAALQTAASMLGRLNERKSLVYFASGLRLNGANNQAQLQATVNAAVRAGVSFWPVDARGLVAQAPLGDAQRGSPGGLQMYNGAAAGAVVSNLQRSQDTLWTLAADTGGKALLDFNDLSQGIVQAQQSVRSYYILGYYTTNDKADGKFRRVKIALADGIAANLSYREGYYASKDFSKYSSADKERQLEDALLLGDPMTELTIALETAYFQLNSAEYFVTVAVKLPGSELPLARKRGAPRTRIDFLAEVKDDHGSTMTNVRDKVDIELSNTVAAELASRPIEYDTGFTLLPGKYKIKFLARDAETGRTGTYETWFTVPNLAKEKERIPLSSVVLSSQRVPMREALYNASKDKLQRAQTHNPLVHDGAKLIPSVTRVFSRAKDMHVYLQAYDPARVVACVTVYREGRKVFETNPTTAGDPASPRLPARPVRLSFPLASLSPGEHTVQISLVDAANSKAAFWQAPVMIAP